MIAANHPLDLDEPAALSAPRAAPVQPSTLARVERVERGRVLINVPRSFYYSRLLPRADHHEPTLEELHAMAARIEEQIREAASLVVHEPWVVDVNTIPDDLPPPRPAVLLPGPDSRRKVMDWGIVASVAAAIAVVAALGSWIQVARRPARPVESDFETRQYRADSAAEPGPSERVRELVRRDPEAAASVLQRWTAPEGCVS
jgi:flagellar biosynthesis/type III secretory pathway M-ring protein FliF/YscJ